MRLIVVVVFFAALLAVTLSHRGHGHGHYSTSVAPAADEAPVAKRSVEDASSDSDEPEVDGARKKRQSATEKPKHGGRGRHRGHRSTTPAAAQ